MSQLVEYQLDDNIATLTLNNGKANVFSPQLIEQFHSALDQAENDKAVVVITGSPGMFSGGYDLSIMQKSMQDAMALVALGSKLSRRLLAFPLPVIIACTGHAVAKGAFMLLSADYRIGVQGNFKLGLNETAIGMTMHHAGIELARGRLSPVYMNRCVNNAEMFAPDDAVAAGFLDVVVSPEQFQAHVQAAAKAMGKLDQRAHRQTKLKVRKQLLETLDWAIEQDKDSSL